MVVYLVATSGCLYDNFPEPQDRKFQGYIGDYSYNYGLDLAKNTTDDFIQFTGYSGNSSQGIDFVIHANGDFDMAGLNYRLKDGAYVELIYREVKGGPEEVIFIEYTEPADFVDYSEYKGRRASTITGSIIILTLTSILLFGSEIFNHGRKKEEKECPNCGCDVK